MENPKDYQYDIDVGVGETLKIVVVWLVLGYLILPTMYYGVMENLASSVGELAIVVRVVGLSTLLWILVYHLLYLLPSLKDLTQED